MKVAIEIDTSKLTKAVERMGDNAQRKVMQALAVCAYKIEGDAKEAISRGSRSGRIYKRGKKTHQASAPSEFPKTDTGALVSAITTEINSNSITVGSRKSAPHGLWLEYGTSKMLPRPWLHPSYLKNKDFIEKILDKTLQDVVGGKL